MKHVVFADAHVAPKQNLERFTALNRLLKDVRPQTLVCLGDIGRFDSINFHDAPGTLRKKLANSLAADADSVKEAQHLLFKGLPSAMQTILCKGNHEERFDRLMDKVPELEGTLSLNDLCEFDEYWDNVIEYRDYVSVDDILYTHVPHNGMGRAVSGAGKCRRGAIESTQSMVFGHGHDLGMATAGSLTGGPARRVAISAPAFMEDGNIEPYARGIHTGWTYGLLVISPQGADRVPGIEYITMRDLLKEYA